MRNLFLASALLGTLLPSAQAFTSSAPWGLSMRNSRSGRLGGALGLRAMSKTASQMQFSKLGNSDLLVSRCCMGTMTFGQQNTLDEGVEQLNIAFDEYGVNFLDTAEMYPVPVKAETQGATDKSVAKFLKGRKREDVILATKVAGYSEMIKWLPGRDGGIPRVNRDQIIKSVDASLERLGTDYIDLLQIHWPDRYVANFGQFGYDKTKEREAVSFEEQLRALEEVIKAGKVRHIGVSNETPYGVMKFKQTAEDHNLPEIVSIQNVYSLLQRMDFETNLAETCTESNCNVGLMVYSPLAGGVLSGKYTDTNVKKDDSKNWRLNLFEGYMARYLQSTAKEAVSEYCKVAEKHGVTPTEMALMWSNSRDFVSSTIIGATTTSQLRENIEAFSKEMTPEMEEDIQTVFKKYKDPARN